MSPDFQLILVGGCGGALIALVFCVAPALYPVVRVWRVLLRAQQLATSLPPDHPVRESVEVAVGILRGVGFREPQP